MPSAAIRPARHQAPPARCRDVADVPALLEAMVGWLAPPDHHPPHPPRLISWPRFLRRTDARDPLDLPLARAWPSDG